MVLSSPIARHSERTRLMKREKITDTRIALPLLASKTLDEKLLSLRSGAKLAPRPQKRRVAREGKFRRVIPARAGPLSHGSGPSLASGGRRSGESGSGAFEIRPALQIRPNFSLAELVRVQQITRVIPFF